MSINGKNIYGKRLKYIDYEIKAKAIEYQRKAKWLIKALGFSETCFSVTISSLLRVSSKLKFIVKLTNF
jgi:hypothetical protein